MNFKSSSSRLVNTVSWSQGKYTPYCWFIPSYEEIIPSNHSCCWLAYFKSHTDLLAHYLRMIVRNILYCFNCLLPGLSAFFAFIVQSFTRAGKIWFFVRWSKFCFLIRRYHFVTTFLPFTGLYSSCFSRSRSKWYACTIFRWDMLKAVNLVYFVHF